MSGVKKVVHFHVYNPRQSLFEMGANDRAQSFFVWCSLEEPCPVQARGQCVHRNTWFGSGCPYGTRGGSEGPTKRAATLSAWIKRQTDLAGENPPSLSVAASVMARIGEYVWLPYPQMDFARDTTTLKIQIFGGRKFLRVDEFTPEVVRNICEWRPRAIFGGEIKTYQTESVPTFVRHFREAMPDLFARTLAIYPRLGEILGGTSDIGRNAVLGTLAPNVGVFVDIHGSHWTWDGEWLASTDSHTFGVLVNKFSEVRIKPDLDCEVKVTDQGQVTGATVFRS